MHSSKGKIQRLRPRGEMLVKSVQSFMTLGSHFESIAISANVMRTGRIPVRKKPVVQIEVDVEPACSMSVTRSARVGRKASGRRICFWIRLFFALVPRPVQKRSRHFKLFGFGGTGF